MRAHVTNDQEVGSHAAQQSHGERFEQALHHSSTALFQYIYRFVGNEDTARDIRQQVFVQLYLFLPTLHAGHSLTAWLFQVARNCCIDELRRKRAICFSELEADGWRRADDEGSSLLSLLPHRGPQPDEEVEQRDLQRRLRAAISALPPHFRAVVSLRYSADLSYAEIGAQLHIPAARAKSYFFRAKPLLRTLLIKQDISAVA
ncbi:MAG TPA: sigma-70 family RNA polymerase sigma factor [Ktedonobacteraceae bacterium]|nr:sigma-70 family RNA polymerase sigma factor [Ktedonobacteraceae bacterium]